MILLFPPIPLILLHLVVKYSSIQLYPEIDIALMYQLLMCSWAKTSVIIIIFELTKPCIYRAENHISDTCGYIALGGIKVKY